MPSRSSIAKNDVRRGKKAEGLGDSGKKAGHCGGGGKKTGKGNGYVCRHPQTSCGAWGMHHDRNPRRAKPKLPTQVPSAALEPKYLQPSWRWLEELEWTPSGTLILVKRLTLGNPLHQDMGAGCQIAPRRRIRRRLPLLKNKIAEYWQKRFARESDGPCGVVYITSLSGNTRIAVAVNEFDSVKFILKEAARRLDKDETQLELGYRGNILAEADPVADLIGKELTVAFGGVVYINSLSGDIRIPVRVKADDPVNVLLEEAARHLDIDTCEAELKLVCGAEVLDGADHVADLIGKELTVIIPARRLNRGVIETVMQESDCTLSEAVLALRANNYGETTHDIVEAIMALCSGNYE